MMDMEIKCLMGLKSAVLYLSVIYKTVNLLNKETKRLSCKVSPNLNHHTWTSAVL